MDKHGRLIDADALEKDGWMMHRTRSVDEKTMVYETKKTTKFPTIEPERKTGKWVTKSTNGEMFDCCSVCGYVEWDVSRNFCPNCGADMRGEEE